jgi:hypothetical protein
VAGTAAGAAVIKKTLTEEHLIRRHLRTFL